MRTRARFDVQVDWSSLLRLPALLLLLPVERNAEQNKENQLKIHSFIHTNVGETTLNRATSDKKAKLLKLYFDWKSRKVFALLRCQSFQYNRTEIHHVESSAVVISCKVVSRLHQHEPVAKQKMLLIIHRLFFNYIFCSTIRARWQEKTKLNSSFFFTCNNLVTFFYWFFFFLSFFPLQPFFTNFKIQSFFKVPPVVSIRDLSTSIFYLSNSKRRKDYILRRSRYCETGQFVIWISNDEGREHLPGQTVSRKRNSRSQETGEKEEVARLSARGMCKNVVTVVNMK